jgi:N-acetyl-gamma-glutamyl-phosphate reductase
MATKVFIDGEAGTTGLQIRSRLEGRTDLEFIRLTDANRKDAGARRDALNSADIVILCLPDDAAREAVTLIDNPAVRVIDASSAHRTTPGWTYGLPELASEQRQEISGATRVTNPGCYPTGAVSLIRPLVAGGILPKTWPVTVNAVSGYTGGGKSMIAEFEDESSPSYTHEAYRIYAMGMEHKHVEEIRVYGGLNHRPLFAPAVGRFAQGMIVEVPLQLWALPGAVTVSRVYEAIADTYAHERFVSVETLDEAAALKTLDPEGLNGTNRLKLFVFGSELRKQVRLVALLDNLGKGASAQAVQSMNIMLGLDEGLGVDL